MTCYGSALNRSQSLASGLEKSSPTWSKAPHSRSSSTLSSRHSRQVSGLRKISVKTGVRISSFFQHVKDWEVVDDVQIDASAGGEHPQEMSAPGICEGYLLKRRKWPLKGWHKRYFVLEGGVLRYCKNQQDVSIGRVQGSLDISSAVMSINKKSNRIDLDAGDILYHMKAKSHELFYIWVTNEAAAAAAVATSAKAAVNNKVSAWLQQSPAPDTCVQELNRCNLDLHELTRLIQRLQLLQAGQTFTNGDLQRIISTQVPSRGFGVIFSFKMIDEVAILCFAMFEFRIFPWRSQRIIKVCAFFFSSVLATLQTVHQSLCQERQKLQEVWENHTEELAAGRRSSHRPPSAADSTAEYFDASDDFLLGSSSDVSDESGLSDGSTSNSEPEEGHCDVAPKSSGRRTSLPAPCPDNSHVGLMAILYNNIGKDLARVSMPAALNEPVNLLQRLCEELEYSQLLDTAGATADPYQRMVYIAAFAISGYSTATFRNRYKPFNPVLGETYECVRDDLGFRFIGEQVCHHPPISACHAESENFSFWQDQRWKNKFWGKSLEIVPSGMVNVTIPRYGDHYEWNKVVTCIHNVLSQQRYLEHYGEVTIRNLKSNACTCKITFVKSRYWGSEANKNEVQGSVLDQSGSVIHRFGGLWHEGIFCDTLPTPKCVWKPNPPPKDHLIYYGFSAFAMELNQLTADLKHLLPPTDSRLRPDQRMLEEGRVEETDRKKDEIEELQRERRKELAKKGEEHVPAFFKKAKDSCGRDVWLTNGTYWKLREDPGFAKLPCVTLW
uniref:Oxysterol-binding protein n=1 Tax=Hippocampus comes TaxID=109280 RepID=A0A3Q2Z278_HIPCM